MKFYLNHTASKISGPLSIWLAVELISRDDPQPGKQEYKWVQAAKIIHRQASGTHKKWEYERRDGSVRVEEMHTYPPPEAWS